MNKKRTFYDYIPIYSRIIGVILLRFSKLLQNILLALIVSFGALRRLFAGMI